MQLWFKHAIELAQLSRYGREDPGPWAVDAITAFTHQDPRFRLLIINAVSISKALYSAWVQLLS